MKKEEEKKGIIPEVLIKSAKISSILALIISFFLTVIAFAYIEKGTTISSNILAFIIGYGLNLIKSFSYLFFLTTLILIISMSIE